MRLSEAIRLGAMLKPQTTMNYFDERLGATCALGAALDAVGMLTLGPSQLGTVFPIIDTIAKSPRDNRNRYVYECIWDMNDVMGLTREHIADWVETIERAQEQQQPEPDLVAVEA